MLRTTLLRRLEQVAPTLQQFQSASRSQAPTWQRSTIGCQTFGHLHGRQWQQQRRSGASPWLRRSVAAAANPLEALTKGREGSQEAQNKDGPPGSPGGIDAGILATIAVVVGTGVANRVLYKLALVPMGDYVFVLSQFQTFGYVLVYASLLAARLRSGEVDRTQVDVTDKRLFLGIGALEAASSLLGFIGASRLPGVTLPLLSQSIIFFNLALSYLVLQKPLSKAQILGASAVAAGVALAAFPAADGASVFTEVDPLYAGIFISSMAFPALASIFKEKIFAEAKEKMNGKPLDIFVVNTLGSGAQALCVLLLLPVLVSLRGLSFTELPQYVSDGVSCFCGNTPGGGSGCEGAPMLPVAYVGMNLAYNISLLYLLRRAGAVVQSLTNSSLTPLTIYAFTFSLPYLGTAPELGPQFAAGSTLLVAGLLTFNSDKWRPALMKRLKQSK